MGKLDGLRKIKHYLEPRKLDGVNDVYIKSLGGDYPIQEIEIETLNRCNGTCPFCPVNANEPQRPYAKMTEELFEKIIAELGEMDYHGKVSMYSNNEPLLDERIFDFCARAKEKIPNGKISLFTNGSLLTMEKFQRLLSALDELVIDNYNDAGVPNPNLEEIYNYLQEHEELRSKVNFWLRKQNEVLTSRGGQAPNRKNEKFMELDELCLLPFRMFCIRPTGEVSLCANDARGVYTMGDVSRQTIMEVWNGPEFQRVRENMLKRHRRGLTLCGRCDTRTVPSAGEAADTRGFDE